MFMGMRKHIESFDYLYNAKLSKKNFEYLCKNGVYSKFSIMFKNKYGLRLRGIVSGRKNADTAVLFLHGFPGSMSGTAKRVCNALGKLGYLCMRFDFSGTDTSGGRFEDKLMGREVEDVKYAVDFLQKNYGHGGSKHRYSGFKRLILVGISTGAIDAALYAHRDTRVTKLVLLSGVSDLKHAVRYDFSDEQVHDFWKKGHIMYSRPGHWVHRKMLKKAFYDEFFTLDIPKALKKYHRPILIVHGGRDGAVPMKEAHELHKIANKPKKLALIKNADHRFSGKKEFKRLIGVMRQFIGKQKING